MTPGTQDIHHPETLLITGATGGIGWALALAYAAPGRTLILHGRNAARLDELQQACQALGARVVTTRFDLCDPQATIATLRELSQHEQIDLAIVNAGVTRPLGDGDAVESWDAVREVLAVNLDGALATVAGVLPRMRQRGSGQGADQGDLAAWVGLPRTPTYSASKAALKVYGEALRAWLAPQGIAVNVVLPGYVHTAMTGRISSPKPSLMTPARAATLIRRGLERNHARITFPAGLATGTRLLSMLPADMARRVLGWMGYGT